MKKAPVIYGVLFFLTGVLPLLDLLSDSPNPDFIIYVQNPAIRRILQFQLIPSVIATIYFLNPFKNGILEKIYSSKIQIAVSIAAITIVIILEQIEIAERVNVPYFGEYGDKHGDYFILIMLYYPAYILFTIFFKKIYNFKK